MKKCIIISIISIAIVAAQHFPDDWSQSYCTYDVPEVYGPGEYGIGFSVDNYTIYSAENDTLAYDLGKLLGKFGR